MFWLMLPPPTPLSPDEEAKETIEQYYSLVNAKTTRKAWSLYTPDIQEFHRVQDGGEA